MENNIIALLVTAVLGGVALIFHEFIKNLISSYFSNLSKGQINTIFISMVLIIAVLVYPLTKFIAQEAKNKEDEVSKEVTVPKTKEEVYKEIGEAAISKIESIAEKKRKKDSIILANRPQKWVYQIGAPLTELDDVFYKYRLL